jgi:phosphatidylglycerophosphatase A
MNVQTICKQIATLGAIGYTKMPGTIATLATLPVAYIVNSAHLSPALQIILCAIFVAVSYAIIKTALPLFIPFPEIKELNKNCSVKQSVHAEPVEAFFKNDWKVLRQAPDFAEASTDTQDARNNNLNSFICDNGINKKQDPSEIVLDEVAGCLITFCTLPLTPMTIIIGFILFRFFDIVKPFFIKQCENLPGAFGIIADDIAAGVIAHGFLRLIMLFIS